MPILPLGALGGVNPLPGLSGAAGAALQAGAPAAGAAGTAVTTGSAGVLGPAGPAGPATVGDPTRVGAPAGSFEATLAGAIDNLQALQTTSDVANIRAVTGGNLDDIHTATIAAARVQTAVQLVAAVRNQAVDAFNQIMRMGS